MYNFPAYSTCTVQCTRVHLCAIPNVDVTNFLKCLSGEQKQKPTTRKN